MKNFDRELLKQKMIEKNLSYKDLALLTNLPEATLRTFFDESRVKNPRIDTIKAVTNALYDTMDDFERLPNGVVEKISAKEVILLDTLRAITDIIGFSHLDAVIEKEEKVLELLEKVVDGHKNGKEL